MANGAKDWVIRFIKGMFIGSGAILPGISGGALAAVFGIYERMIAFIANLTVDFRKNAVYFLPVGLGCVTGVFVLSFGVSYLLAAAEAQILWFFIGCVLGTLPALWKQAAKKGRKPRHWGIFLVAAAGGFSILQWGGGQIHGQLPQNPASFLLSGMLVGLGAIIPGLSPSNFLVYLGLYKPMTDGIKSLDIMAIIPLVIGVALSIVTLSKLMNFIFSRVYTGLFHAILGIVLASTVMIVPTGFNYLSWGSLVCAVNCGLGIALGYWMSRLEERYKPE